MSKSKFVEVDQITYRVSAKPSASIDDASKEAVQLATQKRIKVVLVFNGIEIIVSDGNDPSMVVKQYMAQCAKPVQQERVFKVPVQIAYSDTRQRFLVAEDTELILSTTDASDGEMQQIQSAINGQFYAGLFMQELLDSVASLSSIAEEHGARTLADLMYLQNAILNGGFIDHYPGESKVMEIASGLPSGERWSKFIEVEHMLAAA